MFSDLRPLDAAAAAGVAVAFAAAAFYLASWAFIMIAIISWLDVGYVDPFSN
jgi:hypothetical protein